MRQPVQNLQRERRDESETEPGMEETRHRSAAEQRRQPVKEPGTVDREARKQRKDEEDRVAPVHDARVNRMTKQLVLVHDRLTMRGYGAAGSPVVELTFSKWDEPVSISAPPADQLAPSD